MPGNGTSATTASDAKVLLFVLIFPSAEPIINHILKCQPRIKAAYTGLSVESLCAPDFSPTRRKIVEMAAICENVGAKR